MLKNRSNSTNCFKIVASEKKMRPQNSQPAIFLKNSDYTWISFRPKEIERQVD